MSNHFKKPVRNMGDKTFRGDDGEHHYFLKGKSGRREYNHMDQNCIDFEMAKAEIAINEFIYNYQIDHKIRIKSLHFSCLDKSKKGKERDIQVCEIKIEKENE